MAQIDWNALAGVIDEFSSEAYTPILHAFYPWMVDRLDERDREPATFVDVGCGTALLSERLVEWYPESELTLVDANRAMLDRARERLRGVERVRFVEAEAEAALGALEAASVEAMIFCRSFYALSDPGKTAARAVEALAPGGMVFLFDFARPIDLAGQDAVYAELDPERWPIYRGVLVDFLEGLAEGRYRAYRDAELVSLWRAAGAELVAYQCHDPEFPTYWACFERA